MKPAGLGGLFPFATTPEFLIDAALRNIPNIALHRQVFELNADATLRDIWNYGGSLTEYVYTAAAGEDYYISSSNAGDTQNVEVFILNEDGIILVIRMPLNGTTPVKINDIVAIKAKTFSFVGRNNVDVDFKCRRVYHVRNVGTTNLAGNLYVVEGIDTYTTPGIPDTPAKVKAHVVTADNTSFMSHFTVPSNKHYLLFGVRGNVVNKQAAAVELTPWINQRGTSIFRKDESVALNTAGTGSDAVYFSPPIKLEPLTDIKFRGDASASCKITGSFWGLLMDNAYSDKTLNSGEVHV